LIVEIHQPMRLRTYRFSDIGNSSYYYDDYENEFYTQKISEKCYLPANAILFDLIKRYRERFKLSFLFSGIILDQFELYAPEVLENFRLLIKTGCVELLSGSYSNSFGLPIGNKESDKQLTMQKKRIKHTFGKDPVVFYKPNLLCLNPTEPGIGIFFLSQEPDLNFSYVYSGQNNKEQPFSVKKTVAFLNDYLKKDDDIAILYIPFWLSGNYQEEYECFFEFFKSFPEEILSKYDCTFVNPSEITNDFLAVFPVDKPDSITSRNIDIPFLLCNDLQHDAFEKLYSLSLKVESSSDLAIKKDWLYIQSCDHFYFMNMDLYEENNLWWSVIPYDSPYFAYINYMNILDDFSNRLMKLNPDDIMINRNAMGKWSKALKNIPALDISL
jgi:alpha-amylase